MRTYVIAGNYWQAATWARENGVDPRDYVYVSRFEVVRGRILTPEQVVRVGTWAERPDADQIDQAVSHALAIGKVHG